MVRENICTVNTVITSMVNITGENICTVNTVITSMVNITGRIYFRISHTSKGRIYLESFIHPMGEFI